MKKQEGCVWQMREKRIKSNIKYFRKKEVDLGKFVNHYYIENGLAYISCNVKGIFDIVNPYSVENYEVINSGFADFIEENAYYIPVEYPIVLEICGTNFTADQQEMVKRIVADYYALRLGDKQIDLKINRNKTIFLFVMVKSRETASFPISSFGTLMVDRDGELMAENGISSIPITERSFGM